MSQNNPFNERNQRIPSENWDDRNDTPSRDGTPLPWSPPEGDRYRPRLSQRISNLPENPYELQPLNPNETAQTHPTSRIPSPPTEENLLTSHRSQSSLKAEKKPLSTDFEDSSHPKHRKGISWAHKEANGPKRNRSLVRPERNPMNPVITAPAGPPAAVEGKRTVLMRNDTTKTSASHRKSLRHKKNDKDKSKRLCPSPWVIFSRAITFYAPSPLLSLCGMKVPDIQQAWREKMALVTLIAFLCGLVGFLTFGFQQTVCGTGQARDRVAFNALKMSQVLINGKAYDVRNFRHPPAEFIPDSGDLLDQPLSAGGMDLSFFFQNTISNCRGILNFQSGSNPYVAFPCVMINANAKPDNTLNTEYVGCHQSRTSRQILNKLRGIDVYYAWEELTKDNRYFVVYNSNVLDLSRVNWMYDTVQLPPIFRQIFTPNSRFRGADVTRLLTNTNKQLADCMSDLFTIGVVDTNSFGCITSDIVLYVSFIAILGVILIKFILAMLFGWVLSYRLGSIREETPEQRRKRLHEIELWSDINTHYGHEKLSTNGYSVSNPPRRPFSSASRNSFGHYKPDSEISLKKPKMYQTSTGGSSSSLRNKESVPGSELDPSIMSLANYGNGNLALNADSVDITTFPFRLAHTILLVTAYSEGSHGMRTTLDSLAGTDYPASHKLIFVVADGIITGAGNDMSTPDVCLSMMKDFVIPPDQVQPYSYTAIADGQKRHNMAKVYAGYYKPNDDSPDNAKDNRVPMVLVAKCGTPAEASAAKPGNRGKRDSQIVLMSFLQRVMFDERMTELEYELFNAIWNVTFVTPDNYEICLMVDADTKVYPDCVTRMVACMVRDPQIMGLCGETKIANKTDSWVSMIQVFEYYISHHQAKAFESMFGGVTCLPGCFCMYRIKTPKGNNNYWVPVLASPDIVETYSEFVVDTLHKKNLFLLGEDRFLSTLMLKTFPKRKMMFVPQAVCKTIVPDEFQVLLSQRRRWINSTIHNLLELVLIRDLCGTFCFSMQFLVFIELIGTVVLPAAISFTFFLIIVSFLVDPPPIIPLMLLAAILGLPAVLIVLTTRKLVYVGWMLVYLLALPVWNFVLPSYAFWHFDDFSWGQTRQVAGEAKGDDHSKKEGQFDSSKIIMKRWAEFEKDKRRKTTNLLRTINDSSSERSLDRLGYMTPNIIPRLSRAITPNGTPRSQSPTGSSLNLVSSRPKLSLTEGDNQSTTSYESQVDSRMPHSRPSTDSYRV